MLPHSRVASPHPNSSSSMERRRNNHLFVPSRHAPSSPSHGSSTGRPGPSSSTPSRLPYPSSSSPSLLPVVPQPPRIKRKSISESDSRPTRLDHYPSYGRSDQKLTTSKSQSASCPGTMMSGTPSYEDAKEVDNDRI